MYFIKFKPYMHYSRLGVALSLLHIPYAPSPLGFFCSHFVAHVLEGAGAVTLGKSSRKYFSRDLRSLPKLKLCYKGDMKNMIEQLGIVAKPAIISQHFKYSEKTPLKRRFLLFVAIASISFALIVAYIL